MKVYGTIDRVGVDSFTFNPNEIRFKRARAFANMQRGMKYFEFKVTEEEKEWMLNKEIEERWRELDEFVKGRIKRILKGGME